MRVEKEEEENDDDDENAYRNYGFCSALENLFHYKIVIKVAHMPSVRINSLLCVQFSVEL